MPAQKYLSSERKISRKISALLVKRVNLRKRASKTPSKERKIRREYDDVGVKIINLNAQIGNKYIFNGGF